MATTNSAAADTAIRLIRTQFQDGGPIFWPVQRRYKQRERVDKMPRAVSIPPVREHLRWSEPAAVSLPRITSALHCGQVIANLLAMRSTASLLHTATANRTAMSARAVLGMRVQHDKGFVAAGRDHGRHLRAEGHDAGE